MRHHRSGPGDRARAGASPRFCRYAVGIVARSADELADTAEQARAHGVAVHASAFDVVDGAAVDAFAASVSDNLGTPWALVNNAAVLGPVGRIDDVEMSDWFRALMIDVGAVAATSAAFVPLMREAGGGRIVNVSGGGIGGPGLQPNVSAYTASKGAIAVLTETLARELAVTITVNAVAPGAQPTGFGNEVLRVGPEQAGAELYDATVRNQAIPTALDEFFALVEFLLSPESQWLTGKLLSARWDRVEDLRTGREQLENTSLLTLRRIDGTMFAPVAP